jgi:hypothetical protein
MLFLTSLPAVKELRKNVSKEEFKNIEEIHFFKKVKHSLKAGLNITNCYTRQSCLSRKRTF